MFLAIILAYLLLAFSTWGNIKICPTSNNKRHNVPVWLNTRHRVLP